MFKTALELEEGDRVRVFGKWQRIREIYDTPAYRSVYIVFHQRHCNQVCDDDRTFEVEDEDGTERS